MWWGSVVCCVVVVCLRQGAASCAGPQPGVPRFVHLLLGLYTRIIHKCGCCATCHLLLGQPGSLLCVLAAPRASLWTAPSSSCRSSSLLAGVSGSVSSLCAGVMSVQCPVACASCPVAVSCPYVCHCVLRLPVFLFVSLPVRVAAICRLHCKPAAASPCRLKCMLAWLCGCVSACCDCLV